MLKEMYLEWLERRIILETVYHPHVHTAFTETAQERATRCSVKSRDL